MRSMSRIWMMMLIVGLSLGVGFLCVTPAKATPLTLTNTPISWATFLGWVNVDSQGYPVFDPNYPPLTPPYDFTTPKGDNNHLDGYVFTAVYPGAGSASGKWIYVYQVQLLSPADIPVVNGMSWKWVPQPETVEGITSFRITEGEPKIGFGLGSVDIAGAKWHPHPTSPTADFDFKIENQGVTYIFGLFSSLPPTIIEATIRDSGTLVSRPGIYTPTPEPPVLLLFGTALAGTLMWRRRKR